MSKVMSHMTMSLDGFIADPHDGIDELFGWYGAGDVSLTSANEDIAFNVDEAGAGLLRAWMADVGALVCGRRLFDITDGWGDNHPVGSPVVVVTHHVPDDAHRWPRTTFAGSVEAGIAQAKEIAGDKDVTVASADVARQALDLGLLDEVHVSLVPVLLGSGIPYFANLGAAPHRLEDPIVTPGTRATHLQYAVKRD
ncbi:deaminase [Aeromicrobium sp. Root236]|uniref:dihydrofolate reductase family protein n=1 Tax=Aeromicrobium sp. Root236 TaxID=1736498 RepID=UPI0006FB439F|nr:dihydrofolate reductase family protein [Aeromicrobium sp. Root236]KRC65445.1 deaminase [Aeromicrobium sp. Root236]